MENLSRCFSYWCAIVVRSGAVHQFRNKKRLESITYSAFLLVRFKGGAVVVHPVYSKGEKLPKFLNPQEIISGAVLVR